MRWSKTAFRAAFRACEILPCVKTTCLTPMPLIPMQHLARHGPRIDLQLVRDGQASATSESAPHRDVASAIASVLHLRRCFSCRSGAKARCLDSWPGTRTDHALTVEARRALLWMHPACCEWRLPLLDTGAQAGQGTILTYCL
jgi:hypothetical protein